MFFSILIVIATLGIGFWFLYAAISTRQKSKIAQEWPVARGVVTVSEVVEDRMRSATGKASVSYIPEVRYEYNVNGEKLTGNKIVFGNSSYAYITAAEICEHFPVGAPVDVYYNPAQAFRFGAGAEIEGW